MLVMSQAAWRNQMKTTMMKTAMIKEPVTLILSSQWARSSRWVLTSLVAGLAGDPQVREDRFPPATHIWGTGWVEDKMGNLQETQVTYQATTV